eukprot:1688025-Karenia_brevis.AAC.1
MAGCTALAVEFLCWLVYGRLHGSGWRVLMLGEGWGREQGGCGGRKGSERGGERGGRDGGLRGALAGKVLCWAGRVVGGGHWEGGEGWSGRGGMGAEQGAEGGGEGEGGYCERERERERESGLTDLK